MVSLTFPSLRNRPWVGGAREAALAGIPEDRSCRELKVLGNPAAAQVSNDSGALERDNAATSVCYKLINIERQTNGLHALARCEKLHRLARLHANRMANAEMVTHSVKGPAELQALLQCPVVGENVQEGRTPIGMHNAAMDRLEINRDNLLASDFHEFGVAAARSRDGTLYVCQLFR